MRPDLRYLRLPLAALLAVCASANVAAARQGGTDTVRARPDSAQRRDSARADSLFTRLFGPGSDLGLRFNGRFEFKGERTRNERCVASQYLQFGTQCNNSGFQPLTDFQFGLQSSGTIADRIVSDVNYDSRREFDGSNTIGLSYHGKPGEWLQRLTVGNVSFDIPASRYITSGVPQGNYGLQATAQFGRLSVTAIAAEQKGIVQHDRVFTIGGTGAQAGALDVDDYQVEARRFFFTVDPRQLAGYPNIDILDGVRLGQLASQLADSVRPVRVALYRLLIGGQPPNPNGPQFRLIGDPASRTGPVYEPLRENVDYYVDPSQLWVMVAQPLDPNKERLVVAYTVRVGGRDTVIASTGGTPDVGRATDHEQFANLLWDPNVRPGDAAFYREIRAAYRIGGQDVRRESVQLSIATGGTFQLQQPPSGAKATFLEQFGLAKLGTPTAFDAENRLFPRRGDPVLALSGAATTSVVSERFVVFPSLQPFARTGLVGGAANPANDAIYTTPGEDLYSARRPQPVYRMHVTFESDAGADAQSFSLGATQIRPRSEQLVLDDGTVLRRDVDYAVDYDLGRVTMLRQDSVFARARQVTVRFEETPLFVTTPTTIFGMSSRLALGNGELDLVAIGQRQHSSFTRPQLGYADASAVVAGVSGSYAWDVPAFARAAQRLTGRASPTPSRFRIAGELAASLPQAGASGQAWLETFESDGAFVVPLTDPSWYLSSQPAVGHALAARIGGSATLDLSRAATLAWQTNGKALGDTVPRFTLQEIDPLTRFAGSGIESPEQVLWLTLYPLSIGGQYNDQTKKYGWTTGAAPIGRRWRSIREVLGPAAGVNLNGKEAVEFWALVDTAAARRRRNPTIVVDLGDVSENTVAVVPTQLTVGQGGDSTWTGRAIVGRDTLQSERDPFSRAFNQATNDVGLPGDVVPRLIVSAPGGGGIRTGVAMCARGNTQVARLGDTRTNCTVGNGRLDEWDIDGDNVLNYDASQREQERVFRYVADLADPRAWTRVGGCRLAPNDPAGPAAPKLCWVLVRMPFTAPADTINGGPSPQRVRAMRLTMVSGDGLADTDFSQVVLARLRITGAAWLKRSDHTITGIGGTRDGMGLVFAGTVGTRDSLSTLGYQSPPGVVEQPDQRLTGLENQKIVINESAMRLTATSLAPLERAEAVYKFPEGAKNFRQYRELRAWARGRGSGWGQNGELQFYVKIGRDADNFYAYRTPATAGNTQAAWLPEVRVSFDKLYALRAQLENAYLQNLPDSLSCSAVDLALIRNSALPAGQVSRRFAACSDGYIVYAADPAVSAPNLAAVQELAVGMVRVDSAGAGTSPIMPGDTLELWVDDIRLAGVVNTPGYAGQFAAQANLGDAAQVRLNVSRRDPNFRQLGEAPTYIADDLVELGTTVRLDQFMGGAGGWVLPVTASFVRGSSRPEYLTNSDVPAAGIAGLRTPEQRQTSLTVAARRATPITGSWMAPLVNNLSATVGLGSSDTRNEFQLANQSRLTAGVDYAVGGASPAGDMPGWWTRAFDGLPAWLGDAELVKAMRNAKPRLQPAEFRASGNYVSADESRSSFQTVAASPLDSGRTVDGRTNAWRNATSLEVRPFDALTARWELSSTRDLVRYGDSTASGVAAGAERGRILGVDAGLESERAVTTTYTFAPRLEGWLRPRAGLSTSFGQLRDPNATALLHAGDTTGALVLPRRVNAAQVATGAVAVDLARTARAWIADSATLARLTRTLVPVEISATRTISSAYDGTPFTPGLGMQFGWGGQGTFLSDHGFLATTAASNTQVGIASGLRLPFGVTLDARTQRLASRNWMRRPDQGEVVVDGDLVTLPDLTLRATLRPRWAEAVLASVTTSARLVATSQRSVIPGTAGGAADARAGRSLSYPLSASFAWNDAGKLTTGLTVATTYRTDSLPGTRTDAVSRDISGDVTRSFKLPREWELKSDLRTRVAWSRTTAQSWVETVGPAPIRSRLTDNGRDAVSFNADTDVADNLTFSLQGARIVTFDDNLNRRISQVVLSAVLQISFFAGALR
ncbi:MAG TPA: cell surface protein SprA [Gemmatimonadaceae bacterium]|nr:cell surface protein SprA [Gemmatimonadaceae bacterium]